MCVLILINTHINYSIILRTAECLIPTLDMYVYINIYIYKYIYIYSIVI